MAYVGYQGRSPSPSDEEDYHSADSSPTPSNHLWTHDRDIGQGGFGVVKLFIHQGTGDKIVLKECRQFSLSRESFERWTSEYEILKRLNHPNIVRAHNIPEGLGYTPRGNVPCICMEYCDGGDLRQLLREPENCCGLIEEQIRQICHDVNAGIRFLHSQRVIHRDLKPENILVKLIGPDKVVYKLTDFGYAKSYDQSSVCTSLVGTMQYVAPEVLKGQRYNSSVDFWSFGVVVFECITGIRPFLHGDSAMALAWIDFVAKKKPDVIHLYWKGESDIPEYSDILPKPHRLSKPFEAHLTSWLRTALHYNPEMRGGRRVTTEDAPCLSNMHHILGTKGYGSVHMLASPYSSSTMVVNVVCTTTGEVSSFMVDDSTTIGNLKENVHCVTTVQPIDQYLIRSDGTLPLDSDLVTTCIPSTNVGQLFVFTTSLMPSFKVMHDTNHAVSLLTAYGDEKIDTGDRRTVFSHVFFHIRENHSFFLRLHQAHGAILHQIRRQRTIVREKQENLFRLFGVAKALVSLLRDTLSSDRHGMQNLQPDTLQELSTTWDTMDSQLQVHEEVLHQLTSEIGHIEKETETYLRLADEMMDTYQENDRLFAQYYHTYVARAQDILSDIKTSKGRHLSSKGRMQEVLLEAIKSAQSIIESKLNGVSFCQEYVALGHLIQTIEDNKENLESLRRDAIKLNDQRTEGFWRIFHEQSEFLLANSGRRVSGLVMTSSFERHGSSWSQPQINDDETAPLSVNRQTSSASVSSVESISDPAIVRRISRLQRTLSQDDTKQVLDKNKQLMKKLSTLPSPSHSPPNIRHTTNGSYKSLPPIRAEYGH